MPFVSNQRIRIHYEVEGAGPALVLFHGVSGSLQGWRRYGQTDQLKDEYRLVLIDARGHGASDKPHDPAAYRPELMAADVMAVLDDLAIARAHFWGYSMGAIVGWQIAAGPFLTRFDSLVLGGMSPTGRRTDDEKRAADAALQDLSMAAELGMEAYLAASEKTSGPMSPHVRAELLANDPVALYALGQTLLRWPGVEEDLPPTLTVPCLLYVGEADPYCPLAREAAQHLPNATFVSVPDLDHIRLWFRTALVLPHVKKFLAAVDRGRAGR